MFGIVFIDGTKEITGTEQQVEFAVFGVNSFDFGEQITDGTNGRPNCQATTEKPFKQGPMEA